MKLKAPYVAILDVGHGNSTVVCDLKATIVIDCGLGTSLLEFILEAGISHIEAILISHADQDHIGGLIGILASGTVNVYNIYVNADATKRSKLWDDLLFQIDQSKDINLHIGLSTTSSPFSCGLLEVRVVGPTSYLAAKSAGGTDRKGRKISSNSLSASFHVVYKNDKLAYLAGDIDQISLDNLISKGISLEAPVLVFPHHGGKADECDLVSFTEQLCDHTKPKVVIFSIGRNKHKNPRPEIVKALRSKVSDVRIACTQLSKHCAASLPSSTPKHLAPVFSRGKSQNECCAGTFIIRIDNGISYLPEKASHQDFILASAPTSLCISKIE